MKLTPKQQEMSDLVDKIIAMLESLEARIMERQEVLKERILKLASQDDFSLVRADKDKLLDFRVCLTDYVSFYGVLKDLVKQIDEKGQMKAVQHCLESVDRGIHQAKYQDDEQVEA